MFEKEFNARIEKDPETGLYIGIVPEIPGAHTQAATLEELHSNLQEVVELCLEEMSDEERRCLPDYIGTQTIRVAI